MTELRDAGLVVARRTEIAAAFVDPGVVNGFLRCDVSEPGRGGVNELAHLGATVRRGHPLTRLEERAVQVSLLVAFVSMNVSPCSL